MLARGDLEKKNATVEKTTVLLIQGKKKVAKKKEKKEHNFNFVHLVED